MFSIEKAKIEDYSKIQLLAVSIWGEHYTRIIGEEQVAYMLDKFQSVKAMKVQANEGYVYYCVYNDDLLVGYFSVKVDELLSELFLSKFYIAKSQRGKGFGKSVILFLKYLKKDRGLQTIRLTVNKFNSDSIKAYEKFGFKISKEVVFDIGQGYIMDDYEMIYNEGV